MDEDQVNEEQGSNEPERQEVTFSEASENISSVRKQDPVNLYTFLENKMLIQMKE